MSIMPLMHMNPAYAVACSQWATAKLQETPGDAIAEAMLKVVEQHRHLEATITRQDIVIQAARQCAKDLNTKPLLDALAKFDAPGPLTGA